MAGRLKVGSDLYTAAHEGAVKLVAGLGLSASVSEDSTERELVITLDFNRQANIADATAPAAVTAANPAALTSSALTHTAVGGTADGTLVDCGAAYSEAAVEENFKELATAFNLLRADVDAIRTQVLALVADMSAAARTPLNNLVTKVNSILTSLEAAEVLAAS